MKFLGIILVVIGLVDLGGSYMDFDLWGGFVGVELPELLWRYSGYLEIAVGAFFFNIASGSKE